MVVIVEMVMVVKVEMYEGGWVGSLQAERWQQKIGSELTWLRFEQLDIGVRSFFDTYVRF